MTLPVVAHTRNPGWGRWRRRNCSQRARQRSRRGMCPCPECHTRTIPVQCRHAHLDGIVHGLAHITVIT